MEPTGDAIADARNIFALAPSLAAVLLHTDLPAVAKRRRRLKGPVATQFQRVFEEVLGQARAGNLTAAKALASETNQASPAMIWWVESEAELASRLSKLRELAKRHRLVTGWNAELVTERVALLQLWLD